MNFVMPALLASAAYFQMVPQQAPQPVQMMVPADAAPADGPIEAAESRRVAADFAKMVEENYYDPDTAQRYAAAVRAATQSGAYDKVRTRKELAEKLTSDVQAVAPDGHLRVRLAGEERMMMKPRMMMRMMSPDGSIEEPVATPIVPGPGKPIEAAQWLAPGIAYIRFRSFDSTPETIATAKKFIQDHSDAKTIIFDVRSNGGGASGEADAMLPYLFGNETSLMLSEVRQSFYDRERVPFAGNRREIAGRPGVKVFDRYVMPASGSPALFGAKVFVLTAPSSASAAEDFAQIFKSTKRGTLIGARTAGAGNFALNGPRPLAGSFTAFVPVGRTIDPRTKQGWEGVGVTPDIAVAPEAALVEALVKSGVSKGEAEKIDKGLPPIGSLEGKGPRRPA